MFTFFMLVAVSMAVEYFHVEYNKGSIELYELNKCYCYVDACYKYLKHATDANIINEFIYEPGTNCVLAEGETEPEAEEYTLNGEPDDLDMTYKLVTEIPDHEFYYMDSVDDKCADTDRAIGLMTKDVCERDFYDEYHHVYRTYKLTEDKKMIDIQQYSDKECKTKRKEQIHIRADFDIDTCIKIDGTNEAKFVKGQITAEADTEYIQIEYGTASYEISKLDTCYCYPDDACYKYAAHETNSNKVVEYVYEDEDCNGTFTQNEYEFDQDYDGLKYTIVTEFPKHGMYYFESQTTDCSDADERAKVLLADSNCELDYYSKFDAENPREIYNRYTIKDGKVEMREYLDAECTIPSTKDDENDMAKSQLEVEKCGLIDGEEPYGKFYGKKYEIPEEVEGESSGSISTIILALFFTLLFFF